MAKRLYYPRHTDKDHEDGSKQRTGKNGFALAKKLGRKLREMDVSVTDLFGGALPRTWETLVGVLSTLLPSAEFVVHPYVQIGDDDIFSKVINSETKQLIQEGSTNWKAVNDTNEADTLVEFVKYATAGLKSMFDQMTGNIGLVCGHSPVIEAAATHMTAYEIDGQPGSCEGLIFEQDDSGRIKVAGTITLSE